MLMFGKAKNIKSEAKELNEAEYETLCYGLTKRLYKN